MTEARPERPKVRIVHPGGVRTAAGHTNVYVDDKDITGAVTRIEVVMDAKDDHPVEVTLTLIGAELDIAGVLAELTVGHE